jgi:hypothetical protein
MLIEKQTFDNVKSVGRHRTIADLELVRCQFVAGALAQHDDPAFGLVVRGVTARRCSFKRVVCAGVRFEDVLAEDNTSTLTRLEGCAFRHVTLRGRAGSVMLVPPSYGLSDQMQAAFVAGLRDFYAGVDWALDITEAEFDSTDLYYLPGDLVRYDPETQFLLRRSALAGADTTGLPSYAAIATSRFESTPFDTLVAVAPKRDKKFPEILAQLRELRDRKIAD